jgi:L-ascorbate metabolism protein UlaG (beta-lactamase superfamily)
MRITKFGHACLLIEDGETRILLDPGTMSTGFDKLQDIDAVLVTHDHGDHVDPKAVAALLKLNPKAKVYADKGGAKVLAEDGIEATTVAAGDDFEVNGVRVQVAGEFHDPIHRDLPAMSNVGYLVGGRLFYPGDALTVPPFAVEILALPTGGPWMKTEEGMDYLTEIKPKVAIPVHDALYAKPGMFNRMFEQTAGQIGATLRAIDDGQPIEL